MIRLHGVMAEIAEVAGDDAALAIVRRYGGQRVYFPLLTNLEADKGAWLVDVVGLDVARKIVNHLRGGLHLDIPIHSRERRRAHFERLEREGKSANEIAAALGVCVRNVWYLKAQFKRRKAKQAEATAFLGNEQP